MNFDHARQSRHRVSGKRRLRNLLSFPRKREPVNTDLGSFGTAAVHGFRVRPSGRPGMTDQGRRRGRSMVGCAFDGGPAGMPAAEIGGALALNPRKAR